MNTSCSNLETLKKKVESGVFDDDDDDVMILEEVLPDTPESQKEINVKVRTRTGIQRFLMKRVPVLTPPLYSERFCSEQFQLHVFIK